MNKKEKYSLIILGAGQSSSRNEPSSLKEVGSDLNTLDWLINTFSRYEIDFSFVGGFKLDQVKIKYPDFKFITNNNWEKTGAAGSLLLSKPDPNNAIIVTYSDILYRPETIERLIKSKSNITIAIDKSWDKRYIGRSSDDLAKSEKVSINNDSIARLGADMNLEIADGEFIGLVKFNKGILNQIKADIQYDSSFINTGNLSRFIEWARLNGEKVDYVDVGGDWAELDDPNDLAHFILGTKAQTLERLKPILQKSSILDQYTFSVIDWRKKKNQVIKDINNHFEKLNVVIRSSAINEDGFSSANAGVYESILDIPVENNKLLIKSINEVITSYEGENLNDQILIQPMIGKVKISGVLFTRTLSDGAPYYVINYDDKTGSTDSITSGKGSFHKMMMVRRDFVNSKEFNFDKKILKILRSAVEIESILNYDSLDIEFAITADDEMVVFQVRPMIFDSSLKYVSDNDVIQIINEAENKFIKRLSKSPFILGNRQLFGIMPDWNPAEIIGLKPNHLSISLYKHLIMDTTWALQRYEYGYRDLRGHKLLHIFAGHPYVDVMASINSFIPKDLDDYLAKRFIDFHSQFLIDNPEFHDKIEFEVVPTCIDLDFEKWETRFLDSKKFNSSEINKLKDALLNITNQAINRIEDDYSKLEILNNNFEQIKNSDMEDIYKAELLLDDCKKYGTLPFAHLARAAFIAISFLKSAVSKSIIDNKCYNDFLKSINTVSYDFQTDANKVMNNELSKENFINKYGHIRPGTYDINIKSYKEDSEYYLDPILKKNYKVSPDMNIGLCWDKVKKNFTTALNDIGVNGDIDTIEKFMRKAIIGREYAKFLFTKNLSYAIDLFTKFGKKHGLNREKMSRLSVYDIFYQNNFSIGDNNFIKLLNDIIQNNEHSHMIYQKIELPPLIFSKENFKAFTYYDTRPNFIGKNRIIAEKILINKSIKLDDNLENKIVLIPQADPGYDWLFSRNISGLITIYGGANSHMAIRAAEFGLPAAIGIGNIEFKRIEQAIILCLDPLKEKIDILEI